MLRNLMVTGVISVVMGITTLAFQSLTAPEAQPAMDGQSESSQNGAGGQEVDETPMASQPTPPENMGGSGVAAQASAPASGAGQAPGGMAGGGEAGEMSGMMCPCMQMMMEGGMAGGSMGGQTNGSAASSQPLSNPRTKQQARQQAEQHLKSLGNPNLTLGEVNETAASYEIEVVTKDGSLVNRLIIDKQSGELKTQY